MNCHIDTCSLNTANIHSSLHVCVSAALQFTKMAWYFSKAIIFCTEVLSQNETLTVPKANVHVHVHAHAICS